MKRFMFSLAAAALLTSSPPALGGQTMSERGDHNQPFVNPSLDVAAWVPRLEAPDRDVIANRLAIVAALRLRPGEVIADVGAGTGAYLSELSAGVGPTGHVFAVDIAPGFAAYMRDRVAKAGLGNVSVVLSREDSATLAPASVDCILVVDTYHHFDPVAPMLASLRAALRPGGRLIIVDFDKTPDASAWIRENVRAPRTTFAREIVAAGFRADGEERIPGLRENYFARFRKVS